MARRPKLVRATLALSLLLGALPAQAAPFPEELRRACPAKRFDWLNPGIIIDGVDAFKDGLPPAEQRHLEALAKPALDRCEAGAGCVNAAYIGAARRIGRLPDLLKSLCALPWRCTAPFSCDPN